MNDRELELRLQGWYRVNVAPTEAAPPALRAAVLAIPRTAPRPLVRLDRRKPLALLAAAVLLGALAAFGSGVLKMRPTPTLGPSPSASSVTTTGPTVEPTSPAASPVTALPWSVVGEMQIAREHETATLLPNGTVLVVGGNGDGGPGDPAPESAEVFDPISGAWTLTEPPPSAHYAGHTATLLHDGTVLVVGGSAYDGNGGGPGSQAAAELYDPATGVWTATGSLKDARQFHEAFLLPDGSVVVFGGFGPTLKPVSTAEVYDPRTGEWAPTDVPRVIGAVDEIGDSCLRTTVGLPDGRFAILCGTVFDGDGLAAAVYAPETGTTTTASPPPARLMNAVAMLDGRVFATDIGPGAIFDPSDGTWSTAALPVYSTGSQLPLRVTMSDYGVYYEFDAIAALGDGTILLTIGATVIVYDPGRLP
jgi:hypothetical protein